ncbi:hypothetical protein AOL_s00176g97 [Orbilia oligospora ATCC 24927]|uniref:BTB domain-containing protein n=1 Tax=Arthrobotrys oligospora (strain ATCC 24927 / CBS 115.81 / DSM 1491) TaxID=756982 RepID=G1XPX2_ARTOA|nr:hypothetical protein AOL_s00176g97 [Orbilia oligospora ATCC 24927]EGX44815.1 hypothetical protein AOL_s00176g97 [Orbilia oligospora ATCC 24927]
MASTQETSAPPAGDANTVVEPIPDPDADGDQPAALVKMYHDPQFSDIKVFAGEDKECFDLHRVILAARSKYFELACKGHFEEGRAREIYLPDIKPKTFTVVALWMYGGGFKYPDPFDKALIQDVFIAADYLQILPLKNAIISAVEEKFWDMPNRNVGDAYDMLETFCAHSKFTDWGKFRLMVASTLHRSYMGPQRILRLAKNGAESSLLMGLIIEAFQNRIRGLVCSNCQTNNDRTTSTSAEVCIGAYCNRNCLGPANVNPFD